MCVLQFLRRLDRFPILGTLIALGWAIFSFLLGHFAPTSGVLALIPSVIVLGWLWPLRYSLPLTAVVLLGNFFASGLSLFLLTISTVFTFTGSLVIFSLVAWVASSARRAWRRVEEIARHDSLTGLMNSHGFQDNLIAERNRAVREDSPLTIAYLDCDNFKRVNDKRGHAAGDQLLIRIGERLAEGTRNYDTVARLGGDEFGIILPQTDTETARLVLDRLAGQLREAMQEGNWEVTFSVGVVTFVGVYPDVAVTTELADQQMYAVKKSSKNAIVYSEIVDGELKRVLP